MNDEILERSARAIHERLEASAQDLLTFVKIASVAAHDALAGQLLTSHEVDTLAALIRRRCFETVLLGVAMPSRGALRDAALAAGLASAREVKNVSK